MRLVVVLRETLRHTRVSPEKSEHRAPARAKASTAKKRNVEKKQRLLIANAPCWSATSCSPTDFLRSTIGARELNFWVRNGTRCAFPAIIADQQGVFDCQRGVLCTLRAAQCDMYRDLLEASHKHKRKRRARPISIARLNALPHVHLQPINLVVYKGSYRKENSSWDGLPA